MLWGDINTGKTKDFSENSPISFQTYRYMKMYLDNKLFRHKVSVNNNLTFLTWEPFLNVRFFFSLSIPAVPLMFNSSALPLKEYGYSYYHTYFSFFPHIWSYYLFFWPIVCCKALHSICPNIWYFEGRTGWYWLTWLEFDRQELKSVRFYSLFEIPQYIGEMDVFVTTMGSTHDENITNVSFPSPQPSEK